MFENPRRGRQARNFTANVPKILDLESSSEQMFSENWRWVPLMSVIASQDTICIQSQSLQHPTIAVLLIKILIVSRPLSSVHLFQSNQSFEAIENRFDQATIISPNFHRLRWECLAQLLPFCVINAKKNALQIMKLAAYANETKK